jgi:hypothetical protein
VRLRARPIPSTDACPELCLDGQICHMRLTRWQNSAKLNELINLFGTGRAAALPPVAAAAAPTKRKEWVAGVMPSKLCCVYVTHMAHACMQVLCPSPAAAFFAEER